jgi:hypothetical protein
MGCQWSETRGDRGARLKWRRHGPGLVSAAQHVPELMVEKIKSNQIKQNQNCGQKNDSAEMNV